MKKSQLLGLWIHDSCSLATAQNEPTNKGRHLGVWRLRAGNHQLRELLISCASLTGRCNTIRCIDSAMLPRENHLFSFTWTNPSQGSVPAGLSLASNFSFCFQCKVGSSLVLRRPIETTGYRKLRSAGRRDALDPDRCREIRLSPRISE